MRSVTTIALLVLSQCASNLYAQAYILPGPDGRIPPVNLAALKALDGDTDQPTISVNVLPQAKLPEDLDVSALLEKLAEQSYEECELGWRKHFDPQKYRVHSWRRTLKSVNEVDGELQIAVSVLLALEEIRTDSHVSAGIYKERYRQLPSGELELIERTPFAAVKGLPGRLP